MQILDFEKIKFKKLTFEEMLLHLDRLTRFKHPSVKYERVFREIIQKNLITPKLSKKSLDELLDEDFVMLVETIWNCSTEGRNDNFSINEILVQEEENSFVIDGRTKKLIHTKIKLGNLLDEAKNIEQLPKNIKRLLKLKDSPKKEAKHIREDFYLKFPIEKIVIAEGITENILIPRLSDISGYSFDQNGVELIGAGGKNQVAKAYVELIESSKLPILILLDSDAKETAAAIEKKLRPQDTLFLLKNGEFEDILPIEAILKTFATFYKNIQPVFQPELEKPLPMTKILEEIFREKGFGEFKKAQFAKQVAQTLDRNTPLTAEITAIVSAIKSLAS